LTFAIGTTLTPHFRGLSLTSLIEDAEVLEDAPSVADDFHPIEPMQFLPVTAMTKR
jgi:hypothetical protein